jgi:hypothetical protein
MEKEFTVWTKIADLWPFKSGKSAGLNGRVQLACPIIVSPGASLVITSIPADDRKENGPTYRLNIVQDIQRRAANGAGYPNNAVGDDDIPF